MKKKRTWEEWQNWTPSEYNPFHSRLINYLLEHTDMQNHITSDNDDLRAVARIYLQSIIKEYQKNNLLHKDECNKLSKSLDRWLGGIKEIASSVRSSERTRQDTIDSFLPVSSREDLQSFSDKNGLDYSEVITRFKQYFLEKEKEKEKKTEDPIREFLTNLGLDADNENVRRSFETVFLSNPSIPEAIGTSGTKSARDNMYKLAYILGLPQNNTSEIDVLFEQVFFTRAWELKNEKEIILYFYAKKKAPQWYLKAWKMILAIDASKTPDNVMEAIDEKALFTGNVMEDISNIIQDGNEAAFQKYLLERRHNLFGNNNEAYTARRLTENLARQLYVEIKRHEQFSWHELMACLTDTNNSEQIRRLRLPPDLKDSFPNHKVLENLFVGEESSSFVNVDSVSKMYRFLCFSSHFIGGSGIEQDKDKQIQVFCSNMNIALREAYLPELFEENMFDAFLIHLSSFDDPLSQLKKEIKEWFVRSERSIGRVIEMISSKDLLLAADVGQDKDWASFVLDISRRANTDLVLSILRLVCGKEKNRKIVREDYYAFLEKDGYNDRFLLHWAFNLLLKLSGKDIHNAIKVIQFCGKEIPLKFLDEFKETTAKDGKKLFEAVKGAMKLMEENGIVSILDGIVNVDGDLLFEINSSLLLSPMEFEALWDRLSEQGGQGDDLVQKMYGIIRGRYKEYMIRRSIYPEITEKKITVFPVHKDRLRDSLAIVDSIMEEYDTPLFRVREDNKWIANPAFLKYLRNNAQEFLLACFDILHSNTDRKYINLAAHVMIIGVLNTWQEPVYKKSSKYYALVRNNMEYARDEIYSWLAENVVPAFGHKNGTKKPHDKFSLNTWRSYVRKAVENYFSDLSRAKQYLDEREYNIVGAIKSYFQLCQKGSYVDWEKMHDYVIHSEYEGDEKLKDCSMEELREIYEKVFLKDEDLSLDSLEESQLDSISYQLYNEDDYSSNSNSDVQFMDYEGIRKAENLDPKKRQILDLRSVYEVNKASYYCYNSKDGIKGDAKTFHSHLLDWAPVPKDILSHEI